MWQREGTGLPRDTVLIGFILTASVQHVREAASETPRSQWYKIMPAVATDCVDTISVFRRKAGRSQSTLEAS